ncbi:hypothetical protein [Methylobacterium sp. Leaf118]|uniref:hypothetical protein n=1 Tax=Methylobacterium sp. Leaf118 TaxID=2876562 RepID=UPI001E342A02|nr:hypothetical protein [Methylobacterium sp. Leaf118]
MSDPIGPGPRHPSRLVFVATAAIAATVGLVTGDIRVFILAGLGAVVLLCAVYALLRRRFGWRPLRVDELVNLVGILHP